MQIEIIQISENDPLTPTKNFGVILNRTLSTIKMLHWYVKIYDVHVILGDLYDDLGELFDKLQEEIIGTVNERSSSIEFPNFKIDIIQDENFNSYVDDETVISHYYQTVDVIKDILSSFEFDIFVKDSKTGLNNTKEDILTRINKTNYLLSLIKIIAISNED
jgi:DNA-binding ferritin-like protein